MGKWTKGSTSGLSFTANGVYDTFTGVSVDGTLISSDNYTSESGSTVVTLNASYLETLSAGQHTLRINFTDGYAETSFNIKAFGDTVPQTGDEATSLLWLCITLIAGAALTESLLMRHKRNKQAHR